MFDWMRRILSRSESHSKTSSEFPELPLQSEEEEQRTFETILGNRRDVSALPILSLSDYRQLVANLPRPTDSQIERFADFVVEAKSWYEHLPLVLPGAQFQFYLDPFVALERILLAEHEVIHVPRVDEGQSFHYTWMRTEEYRSRYGPLAFACDQGSRLFLPVSGRKDDGRLFHGVLDVNPSRPTIHLPDGETRLPPEVMGAGGVQLTGIIHSQTSSLGFLPRFRAELDAIRASGEAPPAWLERLGELAENIEPRRQELGREVPPAEQEQWENEISTILEPERQEQHRRMVGAMQNVCELLG